MTHIFPLRCVCGYQSKIDRLEKEVQELTAERDELARELEEQRVQQGDN